MGDIAQLTTLAGYIHYVLTGEKVVGIGEASGMFPIDSGVLYYNEEMVRKFDAVFGQRWKLRDILPRVLPAGVSGGTLTEEGTEFLDPTGALKAGIPVAPCEGDAGTGMAATNSVRVRTGNVSAGTSDFAMLVVDHHLGVHREIDMVTTPAGAPVAMVHCNNCTSDINAVHNAVVMEEVAFMDWHAMVLNPDQDSMQQSLLNKHDLRKHGKNAYYGQG